MLSEVDAVATVVAVGVASGFGVFLPFFGIVSDFAAFECSRVGVVMELLLKSQAGGPLEWVEVDWDGF